MDKEEWDTLVELLIHHGDNWELIPRKLGLSKKEIFRKYEPIIKPLRTNYQSRTRDSREKEIYARFYGLQFWNKESTTRLRKVLASLKFRDWQTLKLVFVYPGKGSIRPYPCKHFKQLYPKIQNLCQAISHQKEKSAQDMRIMAVWDKHRGHVRDLSKSMIASLRSEHNADVKHHMDQVEMMAEMAQIHTRKNSEH